LPLTGGLLTRACTWILKGHAISQGITVENSNLSRSRNQCFAFANISIIANIANSANVAEKSPLTL
jgi:hypothetical protein